GRSPNTRCAIRANPCLEARDFFLELIDPLLQRSQGKLSGGRALARLQIELLKFLKFGARVFELTAVFDGHGFTANIPLDTMPTQSTSFGFMSRNPPHALDENLAVHRIDGEKDTQR